MAFGQKIREATQPERDIQKAVIGIGEQAKIETLRVPDELHDDPIRLIPALGAVAGLTPHINAIVSRFAATYPSLKSLSEFFARELWFLSLRPGATRFTEVLCSLRQASLALRLLPQWNTASADLKPFFEALLLDDVESVKPWLIHEDANPLTLRVSANMIPECLPLAVELRWWDTKLSPLRADGELVNNYSLLELSAAAGAVKCVRFLAEFLHCPVTGVALQLAVRCGHVELMHDLMNRLELVGPVPKSVVLHCARAAIEHCHGAAMAWLLRDSDSVTLADAATVAIVWHKAGPTRRLSKMGVNFQKLAATAGWPSLYRAVGLNCSTSLSGYSSLMHAVMREASEVARDLLGKGANVNEQDQMGLTALQYAVHLFRDAETGEGGADEQLHDSGLQILTILLEAGANTELRCRTGETALHRAAALGREAAVKILVGAHASVDSLNVNSFGFTALHFASAANHVGVLRILLDAHANIEAIGFPGSPLMMAAQTGSFEACKFLLEAGANVQASDRLGLTALDFADANGHVEIAKALLEAGAKREGE